MQVKGVPAEVTLKNAEDKLNLASVDRLWRCVDKKTVLTKNEASKSWKKSTKYRCRHHGQISHINCVRRHRIFCANLGCYATPVTSPAQCWHHDSGENGQEHFGA